MLPALPTGMARIVRGAAKVVADLERGRLLAFEAERVDRVDHRDRVVVLLGESPDDRERLVEVAVDGDDPGPGDQRLEQLADRDLALGQHHDHLHAGRRAVGRRGGRGVAGRGADDGPGPGLGRLCDRDDHAPVLERAGRVLALDLEVEVIEPDRCPQPGGRTSGVNPSPRVSARRRVRDRQEPPVALEEPGPRGGCAGQGEIACLSHRSDRG